MINKKIKAVVFDMDGVLFDTERLVLESWSQVAKEIGLEDIKTVLMSCIGRSYADARLIFLEHYGQDFGYEAFREKANVLLYKEIEDHGMPVKKGVYELLAFLKEQNYKIGLASSTRYEAILSHIKAAEIADYFEVVVGGDMVEHSKPNPEIYLKVCKALEVDPSESYCIEDSPNGIRAGAAAGLNVIMVPDLIQPNEEIRALLHKKFDSLVEVKSYLEGKEIMGI